MTIEKTINWSEKGIQNKSSQIDLQMQYLQFSNLNPILSLLLQLMYQTEFYVFSAFKDPGSEKYHFDDEQ